MDALTSQPRPDSWNTPVGHTQSHSGSAHVDGELHTLIMSVAALPSKRGWSSVTLLPYEPAIADTAGTAGRTATNKVGCTSADHCLRSSA